MAAAPHAKRTRVFGEGQGFRRRCVFAWDLVEIRVIPASGFLSKQVPPRFVIEQVLATRVNTATGCRLLGEVNGAIVGDPCMYLILLASGSIAEINAGLILLVGMSRESLQV